MATASLLEIVNSLVLIFLVTEANRVWNDDHRKGYASLRPLALILFIWVTTLFFVYHLPELQIILQSIPRLISLILSPILFLGTPSSSVSIFLILGSCLLIHLYLHYDPIERIIQIPSQRIALISSCLVIFVVGLQSLGFDDAVPVSFIVHIVAVILSFISLLYLDIFRLRRDIPLKTFFSILGQSVLYSVAAIPILMILISFTFLILATLLQALGTHPEDSYYFNQLIYYGTLYGPCYLIYWNAKHKLLRLSYLPS
jgi:hypothetical protein